MTLTVEISRELEESVVSEADRRGITKEEFVSKALEDKVVAERRGRILERAANDRLIGPGKPVRDRSKEHAWINAHRDEYNGQFVAVMGDQLIAFGPEAKIVAAKIRELKISEALLIYVEGSDQLRNISGGLW